MNMSPHNITIWCWKSVGAVLIVSFNGHTYCCCVCSIVCNCVKHKLLRHHIQNVDKNDSPQSLQAITASIQIFFLFIIRQTSHHSMKCSTKHWQRRKIKQFERFKLLKEHRYKSTALMRSRSDM